MSNVDMNTISYMGTYNLIQNLIENASFLKNDFMYLHNFACGQYPFMKFSPLCSADIELLKHAKNSIFMKNPKWSLFS